MRPVLVVMIIASAATLSACGDMAESQTAQTSETASQSDTVINVEKALAPRALGDPDAPVKIEEYTSLTCKYCARFHIDTFPTLRSEFIDKGIVYYTVRDYPLNGRAVKAAMLARCVPEQHYFEFIELLFDTQESWIEKSDYKSILRQNAKRFGVPDEHLDACWKSSELRQSIYDSLAGAGNEHGVKSVPSFLVNGELKIKGSKPIETFREVIQSEAPDKTVSASKSENGEPAYDRDVYARVASKNIKRYDKLKSGDATDAALCFQAALVAGAYSKAGDEANQEKWEEIENSDCRNVGARRLKNVDNGENETTTAVMKEVGESRSTTNASSSGQRDAGAPKRAQARKTKSIKKCGPFYYYFDTPFLREHRSQQCSNRLGLSGYTISTIPPDTGAATIRETATYCGGMKKRVVSQGRDIPRANLEPMPLMWGDYRTVNGRKIPCTSYRY